MDHLIGLLFVCVIPVLVGLIAIVIPFRSHRATKQDRFLALGVVNAVSCGLAVIALLSSAVFNWYPSLLLYLVIAVGFAAMVLLEFTKNIATKKPALAPRTPTQPTP